MRTAATNDDPMVMHQAAAQAPPPSPTRSSATNVSRAPGGWPATCAGQISGDPTRMWFVKSPRKAGTSRTPSTDCRYSRLVVSRSATPRPQPSTSARDHVQAIAAPQAAGTAPAKTGASRLADRRPPPARRRPAPPASPGRRAASTMRTAVAPQPQNSLRPVDGPVDDTPDDHRQNEQRDCGRHRPQIAAALPLPCTHGRRAA